jgi:DNA-binding beta-propeller fold protein YncE
VTVSKYTLLAFAAGLLACEDDPPIGPEPIEGFNVIAQGFADPGGSDPQGLYEGIAVDETGASVYVGSFVRGTLVRLDAGDLQILGSTILPVGLEGLSVAPGNQTLVGTHRDGGLSVVAIPALTSSFRADASGGFFALSIGSDRALTSGGQPLALVDTESGISLAEFIPPGGSSMWHLAVSPDGSRIAVLRNEDVGRELLFFTPELEDLGGFDLSTYASVIAVAYHPSGAKLYVTTRDAAGGEHFLVIDIAAASVNARFFGPNGCQVFCVANPVATSREGRWVVFAEETGAHFVETASDEVIRAGNDFFGSGVAASPTENAFFFLRSDGLVTKVSYSEP